MGLFNPSQVICCYISEISSHVISLFCNPTERSRRDTEKRNGELERDIYLAQNKVVNKSSARSSHSHSCTSSRRRSCTIWNNNATFCNTDKTGKSTVKGEFLLILQCNYGHVNKPVGLNMSFLKGTRVQTPATVKRGGFKVWDKMRNQYNNSWIVGIFPEHNSSPS